MASTYEPDSSVDDDLGFTDNCDGTFTITSEDGNTVTVSVPDVCVDDGGIRQYQRCDYCAVTSEATWGGLCNSCGAPMIFRG